MRLDFSSPEVSNLIASMIVKFRQKVLQVIVIDVR
jgi:hypothetical protein